jgi:hypothetical protein
LKLLAEIPHQRISDSHNLSIKQLNNGSGDRWESHSLSVSGDIADKIRSQFFQAKWLRAQVLW